jgi:hypothetical protein
MISTIFLLISCSVGSAAIANDVIDTAIMNEAMRMTRSLGSLLVIVAREVREAHGCSIAK